MPKLKIISRRPLRGFEIKEDKEGNLIMNKRDSLGDRMKGYEATAKTSLYRRVPVIMRLDGRAFHTFTKKFCERPFDSWFQNAMRMTAQALLNDIQGAKCAYVQSDEITILMTDFDTLYTEPWFNYNVMKMCSNAASTATAHFNTAMMYQNGKMNPKKEFTSDERTFMATFDARCFNIPESDVENNLIWRQKDWLRNSIQMYCRSFFSQKEMNGKKQADMHDMLHKIGKNWTVDLAPAWKNGIFIYKKDSQWVEDSTVIFTENRELIRSLMRFDYAA